MAAKRNVRAACLTLDKATNNFVESQGSEQKEARKILEEELADVKCHIRLGKKDHVDVGKLSEKMASARLVLKMNENRQEKTDMSVCRSVEVREQLTEPTVKVFDDSFVG